MSKVKTTTFQMSSHKREESLTQSLVLPSNNPKKINPAPLDSKSMKTVKVSQTSHQNKSPSRQQLKQSLSNTNIHGQSFQTLSQNSMNQTQKFNRNGGTNHNHSNTNTSNKIYVMQHNSRVTNMSTSGSYSSSSFGYNESMRLQKQSDTSNFGLDHSARGASQNNISQVNFSYKNSIICQSTKNANNIIGSGSNTYSSGSATTSSSTLVSNLNQQRRIIQKQKGKSVSSGNVLPLRQNLNQSPMKSIPTNDSQLVNIQTPAIIRSDNVQINFSSQNTPAEKILLSIKKQQSGIIAQKSSFKDSFVDSENFMNVEEKENQDLFSYPSLNIECTRDIRQKSLNDMIKEKYLGPILKSQQTNSNSFMKRNILLTTSNCSNRSSTCSIKSSFLTKQSKIGINNLQKGSFQDANETNDELEDNTQTHCCDSINQYSLLPKTIFGEIVNEIHSMSVQKSINKEDQQQQSTPKVRSSIAQDYSPKSNRNMGINLGPYSSEQQNSGVSASLSDLITAVPQNQQQKQMQLFGNNPQQSAKQSINRITDNSQNQGSDKSFKNSSDQNNTSSRLSRQTHSNISQRDSHQQQQQNFEYVPEESNSSSNQEDIIEFLQSDTHKMHLIQTLQSLQYVKNFLQQPSYDQIYSKRVNLPHFRRPHINKTIIFDLDETLVHCVEDILNNPADRMIKVQFPNGEVATAGVNIRPYAIECLRRASQLFQIVVFTASHKSYADVVLDILDPKNEIFEMRLYRESCVRSQDGVYVKDLRIFEHCRSLSDMVLVDNAVYSFGYQLENGIPIIPFYDDKEDEELLHLSQYLECLAKNGGDVREHNRKAFQLRELQELDVQQFLQNMITESQLYEQEKANNLQKSTSNKSQTQWEILQVDSSIINEEPQEDEESSIQESSKLKNRRRQIINQYSNTKSQETSYGNNFIEEVEYEEEEDDQIINNRHINNYDYDTVRESQRVHTSTSILDRDNYD
ncbi:nli interacting factor-like phosphatase family protein [Stylonychia lemnae]|uniref:Nli interacting factor-like phosphatase family protein n=1 Tax=Stylonychia lemnae TaxID=5949 RepID=A0A078ADY2_STYLE|nr:nli interacting factor-like phosphatase family protein [Stylonychia lemnae]|eukprot:CDW79742.1 nli interacting factor-like phosphatase family protein [Stylonychia lemnae]